MMRWAFQNRHFGAAVWRAAIESSFEGLQHPVMPENLYSVTQKDFCNTIEGRLDIKRLLLHRFRHWASRKCRDYFDFLCF